MQLRKVIDDLARIQPSQPGIDVIVSVAPDVPNMVYLDETYTFRVSCCGTLKLWTKRSPIVIHT